MSTISTGAYPPGPKVSYLDGLLLASRLSDPLRFLTSIAREYGDVAHFQIGARHIFLLNHPEHIKDALTNYYENFSKTDSARKSRHFLGDGLITGEGDYHRSQRQLIRPAFCPQRIVAHASLIVEHGLRCRESWQDGQTLDISREMTRLTLGIISKLLFSFETVAEADEINRAVSVVLSQFSPFGKPFTRTLERLFRLRRTKRAQARIDEIIHKQISVRRDGVKSPDDLLSLLMSLDVGAGQRMTGRQLRDEALTIFLAGHETVANALMWTWYLLSQHPIVEAKLFDEVDTVLGSVPVSFTNVQHLPYTEKVLTEALRLFPPGWALARFAIKDYRVGTYMIPAGSVVIISQYVMHRDPRYFPDPDRFDPERWTPEAKAARPSYTYFPFGGGPRRCIGENLAWMQAKLLIATLAQRWRMRLVQNHPVKLNPVVTLRPRNGIMMRLERRGS